MSREIELPTTKPPAPAEFVRLLAPALRQAAQIARALEGRVANRPKAGEESPAKAALTLADTACQEALLVALLEHFPQVELVAEEATPSVARFPRRSPARVVVDPIDGTLRSYLEGRGPYAVMLGLAVGGAYEAALVALPREGLCFDAVRGAGARVWRADGTPRTPRLDPSARRVFVSHGLPEPAREVLARRGFEAVPASGGAIAVAPFVPGVRAGLRLVRPGERRVSPRGRIGLLVAEEAGALTACELGAPFPREIDAPAQVLLVAGDAPDLEALGEAAAAALPYMRS
jgi:hypothetical protein